MSSRRLAVFLLGVWLGCSLFMVWVATNNLRSVDTIVKQTDPRLQREVKDIGFDRVRTLMRFEAAELNRHYFYYWGLVQILWGLVTGLVLFNATSANRFTMIMMLAIFLILLLQHFLVAPAIVEIGRGFDFVPADQMQDERRAFSTYHAYFSSMEALKLLLLTTVCGRMLLHGSSGKRRHRSSGGSASAVGEGLGRQVDLINKADDGHVDR